MIVAAAVIVAATIAWAALHIAADCAQRAARMRPIAPPRCCSCSRRRSRPRRAIPARIWCGSRSRPPPGSCFRLNATALDRAAGGAFPFTPADIQAAHARWTTDWLAWERAHDAEYKLKTAQAHAELVSSGATESARSKVDAIEREKLDRYQQRYADYVRIAKALQALSS